MQDPAWVDALPAWLQAVVTIVASVVLTLGGVMAHRQGKKQPPSEDFVLSHAAITDTKPMRDVVDRLDRLVQQKRDEVKALERIAEATEQLAKDSEIRRIVEERSRRDR